MKKNFGVINRRWFLGSSLAGLATISMRAKLLFGIEQKLNIEVANQELLILNGWVLTRKDVIASETTSDVV